MSALSQEARVVEFQKIKELTSNPQLLEFAEFTIAKTGDKNFPNYQEIDLMEIARLVKNIFVIDFRKGMDDGIQFHFSGTAIDENFMMNITGHTVEEFYMGTDRKEPISEFYRKSFVEKCAVLAIRNVIYKEKQGERRRFSESIMFPCSSNNEDVDFGLGMTCYSFTYKETTQIYTSI